MSLLLARRSASSSAGAQGGSASYAQAAKSAGFALTAIAAAASQATAGAAAWVGASSASSSQANSSVSNAVTGVASSVKVDAAGVASPVSGASHGLSQAAGGVVSQAGGASSAGSQAAALGVSEVRGEGGATGQSSGLLAESVYDPSSWLCDDPELISGSWLASAYPGHGVLGVNVPSDGTDGPSALYGVLSLPADNNVEVRGLITRWPVNGTLTIEEDGSFTYTGTTDYFEFLLYADGVASTVDIGYGAGISRITLQVGAGGGAQQLAFEVEIGHDNPHVWWKRKPKKIDEVTAAEKLKEVAAVIKAKAEKHAEVNASKAYRKADTLAAVKHLIEDMPGFDWQPMYADAYNDALNRAIIRAVSEGDAAKHAQMLEDDDIAVLLAAL